MHRAAIIYGPGDSAIAALAAEMEHAFEPLRYRVQLKEAGAALIPDLAAAEIVLLGSLPEGRSPTHSTFAELVRALRGVNLAGRVAGLFSIGSPKSLEALRRALTDSDILIADEDLLLELDKSNRHGEKVNAWVQEVCGLFERRFGEAS